MKSGPAKFATTCVVAAMPTFLGGCVTDSVGFVALNLAVPVIAAVAEVGARGMKEWQSSSASASASNAQKATASSATTPASSSGEVERLAYCMDPRNRIVYATQYGLGKCVEGDQQLSKADYERYASDKTLIPPAIQSYCFDDRAQFTYKPTLGFQCSASQREITAAEYERHLADAALIASGEGTYCYTSDLQQSAFVVSKAQCPEGRRTTQREFITRVSSGASVQSLPVGLPAPSERPQSRVSATSQSTTGARPSNRGSAPKDPAPKVAEEVFIEPPPVTR